jgi:phytoene dehydrogenase-like protein
VAPGMEGTAAVVGAGANGLTAAALLAVAGMRVTVYEQADTPGGAARSSAVLGEGTVTDLGAAAHPFGVNSPAFHALGLEDRGLEWIHPRYPMAHPLPGVESAILHRDAEETARGLGADGPAWLRVHAPVTRHPREALENVLGPLVRVPPHPLTMVEFGLRAAWPAALLARAAFRGGHARALFAGSSAHSTLPLTQPFTAAFGTIFGGLGHTTGWPVAKGGTQRITDALAAVVLENGGTIRTGTKVTDLRELPAADAVLLDLTPRQLLALGGTGLPDRYRRHLQRWRYGCGVYKVDYLLDGPVPWSDPRTGGAGTVHVGGTFEELLEAERLVNRGRIPERPFVMVSQQSAADPSRAPAGRQVLWTYAHVPNGSREPMGGRIDAQIERFAPGFRDRIIGRVETSPTELEAWNPNLVGGDIGGGSLAGLQQVFRPAPTLKPYNTGAPGVYVCSSSTPPGGGVHGMAGHNAARAVLRDLRRAR